jgi:hypothetical protein
VRVASVRHVTCAKATNVARAKTSDATPAEAADVASAEAADVASAKAANVAATAAHMAATTTVSSATAAAGLRSRGKKAAGKHRTCQNHHHSSSHYTLHWDGRTSAACWTWARLRKGHQRRDRVEMGFLACRLH